MRKRTRSNVLVVAPHPDDDVLGCGGTLVHLVARGARIHVLYVTDGSASHVKSKRWPPAVLRDVRENEARVALRLLGIVGKPTFLRAPDSALAQLAPAARRGLVTAMARCIARTRPQILFMPWLRDPHPDHVATAALVHEAFVLAPRRTRTYMYSVWLAVRGAAADLPTDAETFAYDVRLTPLDITRKHAAILAHRSQTGTLIDDDPDGFCMDEALLGAALQPVERFYVARSVPAGNG